MRKQVADYLDDVLRNGTKKQTVGTRINYFPIYMYETYHLICDLFWHAPNTCYVICMVCDL